MRYKHIFTLQIYFSPLYRFYTRTQSKGKHVSALQNKYPVFPNINRISNVNRKSTGQNNIVKVSLNKYTKKNAATFTTVWPCKIVFILDIINYINQGHSTTDKKCLWYLRSPLINLFTSLKLAWHRLDAAKSSTRKNRTLEMFYYIWNVTSP